MWFRLLGNTLLLDHNQYIWLDVNNKISFADENKVELFRDSWPILENFSVIGYRQA